MYKNKNKKPKIITINMHYFMTYLYKANLSNKSCFVVIYTTLRILPASLVSTSTSHKLSVELTSSEYMVTYIPGTSGLQRTILAMPLGKECDSPPHGGLSTPPLDVI